MPAPVTCPSCGERLDIPADLRGTPVRCAACSHVFAPPPADDDAPAGRPARPAARPADDEYADDRDRPRPRKRGGLGWVWVLFGGLGLLTCACCGGCGALFWWSENPDFVSHTDAAGRYAVEFPGQPHPAHFAVAPKETMTGAECVREMTRETYFVYYADLPAGAGKTDEEREKLLQKYADNVATAKRGKEETRAPLNHKGHPAVEVFTMISPFEGGTMFRVILAEKRVYVIGVTGPIHPDAPRVGHFFESFDVTNPAAAPKGGGNPFIKKDDKPK